VIDRRKRMNHTHQRSPGTTFTLALSLIDCHAGPPCVGPDHSPNCRYQELPFRKCVLVPSGVYQCSHYLVSLSSEKPLELEALQAIRAMLDPVARECEDEEGILCAAGEFALLAVPDDSHALPRCLLTHSINCEYPNNRLRRCDGPLEGATLCTCSHLASMLRSSEPDQRVVINQILAVLQPFL
jgi:hypothetical protein